MIIASLASPYGVRGWLRVRSYTSPPDNLWTHAEWLVRRHKSEAWKPLTWEDWQAHSKGFIVKLPGVDSPEDARQWTGVEVAVDAANLPDLSEDEFYWHQLEGMAVITREGTRLGVVDHLIETGANDVVVVQADAASVDDRERLLPWLPDRVVIAVDLSAQQVTVDWDVDW